jgi:hypothetical protein
MVRLEGEGYIQRPFSTGFSGCIGDNSGMSSAVHSLQRAISDGSQPLIQLLRQTKLIAAKLGLSDVETWVDDELRGYSPDEKEKRPEYREVTTEGLEVFHPHYGWRFAGNVGLRIPVWQPIAEIENLSRGKFAVLSVPKNFPVDDGIGGGLARDWPQRLTVASSEYKRIVEAVTDELLQWTIELEKRGIKGDGMDFNEKEKQSATSQVFNIQKFTGVFGNVTGSQVTIYDYSSVSQLLLDHNVPKAERRELEDIMDDLKNATPEKKPPLIQKGKDWIIKNKEFLGASAEAVGRAIGAVIEKS